MIFLFEGGKKFLPFGLSLADDGEAIGLQLQQVFMDFEYIVFANDGLLQYFKCIQVLLILGGVIFPVAEGGVFMEKVVKLEVALVFVGREDFLGLAEDGPAQVMRVLLGNVAQLYRLLALLHAAPLSPHHGTVAVGAELVQYTLGQSEDGLQRLTSFFAFWFGRRVFLGVVEIFEGFLEEDGLQGLHQLIM